MMKTVISMILQSYPGSCKQLNISEEKPNFPIRMPGRKCKFFEFRNEFVAVVAVRKIEMGASEHILTSRLFRMFLDQVRVCSLDLLYSANKKMTEFQVFAQRYYKLIEASVADGRTSHRHISDLRSLSTLYQGVNRQAP